MPQLDTIFISLIFSWTWLVIYLLTKKVKSLLIISKPKKQQIKPTTPSQSLPWT